MALPNAYSNYTNTKIQTASPAQLTLLLYDGAVKFCILAISGLDEHDYFKTNENIKKVEKIIEEFRATLNFKYPVAKEFDNVYEYINQRLLEANIRKDREILAEVLEHLRTMRETWVEVMKRGKVQ